MMGTNIMKRLTIKLIAVIAILSGAFIIYLPSAQALNCNSPQSTKDQIQCGACDTAGAATCDPSASSGTLSDTIATVINLLSAAVGVIAVIMIIIGGFRFVTSAGSPEAAKSARSTITYAIIGLVVVALAQIIVHFVLYRVENNCVGGKNSSGQTCTP